MNIPRSGNEKKADDKKADDKKPGDKAKPQVVNQAKEVKSKTEEVEENKKKKGKDQ